MNDYTVDPDETEEDILAQEVSDEALEAASGIGKAGTITIYEISYCFTCPA